MPSYISPTEYFPFLALLRNPSIPFTKPDLLDYPWQLLGVPQFQSHYYAREMGVELIREFYYAPIKIPFSQLLNLKEKAAETENSFRDSKSNRQLNLDPGVFGLHQVVVSTFKNYAHRISISPNIWADLQMTYEHHSYQALTWTYPDYKELIPEFNEARKKLL